MKIYRVGLSYKTNDIKNYSIIVTSGKNMLEALNEVLDYYNNRNLKILNFVFMEEE